MVLAVMLPADGARGLMLHTEKFAIHVTGHDMRRAVPAPTIATGREVAGRAVNAVAGGARARAGRTEWLPINAAHQGMVPAGDASA